jgi:hypothetical protein
MNAHAGNPLLEKKERECEYVLVYGRDPLNQNSLSMKIWRQATAFGASVVVALLYIAFR